MPRSVLSSPGQRSRQRDEMIRNISADREDRQAEKRASEERALSASVLAKSEEFRRGKETAATLAQTNQALAQTRGKFGLQQTEMQQVGQTGRIGMQQTGQTARQGMSDVASMERGELTAKTDRFKSAASIYKAGGVTGDIATQIAGNEVSPFGGAPALSRDSGQFQYVAPKTELDLQGNVVTSQPGGVFSKATGEMSEPPQMRAKRKSDIFATLTDPQERAAYLDDILLNDPEAFEFMDSHK